MSTTYLAHCRLRLGTPYDVMRDHDRHSPGDRHFSQQGSRGQGAGQMPTKIPAQYTGKASTRAK
jgi:hypothetical protein